MTDTILNSLTIEDLSTRLGISTRTLRRRMKARGICGAIKVGRQWRFPLSALNSLLALEG